ncbi:MAG: trypsin-like peptidase domain-containing protein [Bacteroidales bacterium]|nr:trypsin-like peptidase domain-containing protein [Bacteroidales bacterium]
MEEIQVEDSIDNLNGVPPRFGYPIEADYTLENSGTWTTLANGDRIWRLSIYCPDALSINLLYDDFWIPEGAKLFIYSADKRHVLGAFTSANNTGTLANNKGFATGLVYGEECILEYYVPSHLSQIGKISIAYVIHGYRFMKVYRNRDFDDSSYCMININCPEGNNWQQEKNAIALILINGIRACTGSLVNNTSGNKTPFLLTANHCLGGKDAINSPDLDLWSFYWNYEAPSCSNPAIEPIPYSTVGATVIANNSISDSDFALLLLTEDPININGYVPYYLGWNKTDNVGVGGVGIHHPLGDVKKISTYNIQPTNSYCASSNNFWDVQWQSTVSGHSVMQQGSSGSPLITNDKKVIGQLAGPYDLDLCPIYICDNPGLQRVAFGKFSVSWTGNGATDNRRKLQPWLDPLNLNPNTLDGISASDQCDLYVRDYATDDGTEPSVTDNMWNSPDIWLENPYGNVIQNPTGGTPCYVCVEVHNRTNIASSGTETLLLNWAKAGVDLQWNHNWTGNTYFNCGGTYVAKGGVITSGETIPAIPANGSTVVRVLWTPPMPSNYSNCTEFNTDPWHFCLAARVHDGNTIPNENSTNYGMGAFTLNSNNVAWKNISIMNSSVNTAVVSVSKPANMTSSLSLEYVEHPNSYGETLSQFARVNMYFDFNLTSAWNLGGSHFSGVKVNGIGEFMVINDTAILSDIMLDTGVVCTMLTEVNFFSNMTPKDNVFEFDIMLYSGTTFIGAEHYVAIKDKKGGIKAIARDDTKSFAGDEVTFYAETNNSNVSYKWYSQNGETLGTGTDLSVYPRQSQSYILEVKSDDEGFIDMDTVCVQICRGAIVGLSPNPTSDVLNIEYRLEESVNNAIVSISNGLGIVMRTIPVSNTLNRNTIQTNIQGLTSGRYSVELKLPNGEILDAKSLIVQ